MRVKYILPRVIHGNLGDLASRWGVLRALYHLGERDVTVFRNLQGDLPPLPYAAPVYRPLHNLKLDRQAWNALRASDVVLWAVGLDMQDDSSLTRMLYLWTAFRLYRSLGLKVICLFQGAGPITTGVGRLLARAVLSQVDAFIARDPGTFALIEKLRPSTGRILAHDAIFLPGFEEDLTAVTPTEKAFIDSLLGRDDRPVIGINLRQWFHFASSLLPYQFSRRSYLERSREKMAALIRSTSDLVTSLRRQQKARLLLISAYQPGVLPWEDDLPWLEQVKVHFAAEDEVRLVNSPLGMPAYFNLMSRLDLMIGMRLHSSLVALRFGVPSINLSYTLKGGDILQHLGLPGSVADLGGFIESPRVVLDQAETMLHARHEEREKVQSAAGKAIQTNLSILKTVLNNP
jgi:polysaccharide pyruvyl transferase WcaK-like protein